MYAVQRIFEISQEQPDAPAMVHNLRPVSYRELHVAITAMRRSLGACGLPAGGVAVVLIGDILTGWIVDLALRTLGLNTLSIRTAEQFAELEGLEACAFVTTAADMARDDFAPPADLPLIVADLLGAGADAAGAESEPPPAIAAGGHILLTSATTGRAKPVLIDAAAEFAAKDAALDLYRSLDGLRRDADERGVMNLMSFGLWTAVGYTVPIRTWGRGGTVITHQQAEAHRSLDVAGVTHVVVTPAFLHWLVSGPPGGVRRNDDLQVLVTGGPLSITLAKQVQAQLTRNVATILGSTESGIWALTPIETDDDLRWHRLHPGRVVEVVDENDQLLPAGELGQLRIRQDNGVAGYFNDPAATALWFRNGYFYPGDLGVLDGKGRLALHGRVTEVINVQGDKAPAAPLEQAIRDALAVEGVCVLSDQGEDGAETLHVVIEAPLRLERQPLEAAAREHVKGFADVYFHFMTALPRNHMGKVERLKIEREVIRRSGVGPG